MTLLSENNRIEVFCWRQLAEYVCKYFAKGRLICGRISCRIGAIGTANRMYNRELKAKAA